VFDGSTWYPWAQRLLFTAENGNAGGVWQATLDVPSRVEDISGVLGRGGYEGIRHLRRILTAYFTYYHGARTHLSLDKDAPDGRSTQPPGLGPIFPIPEVGGLHHRYVRRAA
jgi:hypothetical protein